MASPICLLVSQALEGGQDFNIKGVSNVKRRRLDCGSDGVRTKAEVQVGSGDLKLTGEELAEVLVCQHLLCTAPHLAREFADTWGPSLTDVVASWKQKSENLPDLIKGKSQACTGASPEEEITRRVVLGHLLKAAPHLAKDWLDEHQWPTLSRVVSVWKKTKNIGNPWVCLARPDEKSSLARKLSLMARQENKPRKNESRSRKARDKSPYFEPPPPGRRWVAPPGYGPDPSWHPPVSPFHLVEECLYEDPWRLLVACIFLNKTTAKVAVPIMDTFFSRWGSPEAASDAEETELSELLKPMGLQKKRAKMLIRFSNEYLGAWSSPARDLHGIGKYGEDAWRIFCCGDLDVQPSDKELRRYLSWYRCYCMSNPSIDHKIISRDQKGLAV